MTVDGATRRVRTLDGRDALVETGDRGLAALATCQHGVVSYAQAVAAGVTRRAIERRAEAGRLHRLRRGVYAVGHTAKMPLAGEAAALLACGPGAILSHRSAGTVWGICDHSGTGMDVTVIGRDCGVKSGIHVRRARRLCDCDLRVRAGLRLTGPARTLLDLASVLDARELQRAVDEAFVARLAREEELWAVLDRYPGRRGRPQLRRLLDGAQGPSLTRSEAERRLLEVLRAAGLPPPETNVRIGRYEVDILWRDARVAVEVDGYAFHSTRSAFERDRVRDADLQATGLAVLRVTWRQIVESPEATIARVARLIGQRTAVSV
jgi:very-short-patch-repair endonuclease